MAYMIEVLRQEHCNIESLLRVLERELSVFERGDRPDYEVILAVINYFKDYPDSCHHPKEDLIVEKLNARDPLKAATIGDLEAEHREGAKRLRRVALAVERVLGDQDLLRQSVDDIIRDFIKHERQHMAMEERVVFPAALNVLRPEDWSESGDHDSGRFWTLSTRARGGSCVTMFWIFEARTRRRCGMCGVYRMEPIGAAELGGVIQKYGGNYILAFAAMALRLCRIVQNRAQLEFIISWLNHTPHATAVYASCSASPPPHAGQKKRRMHPVERKLL
jgi:hemerythrin-like domain-containing protein